MEELEIKLSDSDSGAVDLTESKDEIEIEFSQDEIGADLSNENAVNVDFENQIRVVMPKYHNELLGLDYEHSGHTGFASTEQLEAVKKQVEEIELENVYTKEESDNKFATKTEAKEIVTVDIINELIMTQNNAYFLELSRRMAIGEIVVIGNLGSDNAIVTAVGYDEANSFAAWSVGSFRWELDGSGGLSKSNTVVFAIYNEGGVIQYGLQEYPLSDYITRYYADNTYAEKSQVYTKEESDDKYANKSNVYTKTESDNKYATIKTLYDSYATKNEVKTEVANLVNSAPETLDTLGEVAKAIQENDSTVSALNSAIGNKANKNEVYTKNESDNKFADKEEFKHIVTELTEDYFTITDSYISRSTAEGRRIANGDIAYLEKVEGNTIVYGKDENGMNGTIANAIFGGIRSYGVNLTDGQLTDDSFPYKKLYVNLPIGKYTLIFSKTVSLIAVGTSIYSVNGTGYGRNVWQFEVKAEDKSSQWFHVRMDGTHRDWEYDTKISIFSGYYDANNLPPYVEGGTDEIIFQEIELPLGKTLDFAKRKILNYGVKVELTGNEYCWRYPGFTAYKNSIGLTCLKTTESFAYGVSTDFDVIRSTTAISSNTLILGQQAKAVYFVDIINTLGLNSNWVDKNNPTNEEANQVARDFKAYLAERYANGNPVTIYYLASTLQSEEPFTEEQIGVGNEYKAWDGGTETIIGEFKTDETGNSNELTFTQKYNTAIFSRLDNLDKQVNSILYLVYPVGSIYMADSESNNPQNWANAPSWTWVSIESKDGVYLWKRTN